MASPLMHNAAINIWNAFNLPLAFVSRLIVTHRFQIMLIKTHTNMRTRGGPRPSTASAAPPLWRLSRSLSAGREEASPVIGLYWKRHSLLRSTAERPGRAGRGVLRTSAGGGGEDVYRGGAKSQRCSATLHYKRGKRRRAGDNYSPGIYHSARQSYTPACFAFSLVISFSSFLFPH